MFSNTHMQLSIKIPEDSIKMAALKAIKIMREVRDAYLEEGNNLFASELVTPKSIKSSPTNCSPIFEPPEKPKKEFKRSLSWKDTICETGNLCDIRIISPRNLQESPKEIIFNNELLQESPKEIIFNNEPPKESIETKFVDIFQSIKITENLFASVIKTLSPKVNKEIEI